MEWRGPSSIGGRCYSRRPAIPPIWQPSRPLGPCRFWKIGDLHGVRDSEDLVLTIEQTQLTAIAGGELPDRESRPSMPAFHDQSSLTASSGFMRA